MKSEFDKFEIEAVLSARSNFKKYVLLKENVKTIVPSLNLDIFKSKMSTSFEDLGCIGYNPELRQLTATIRVKRPIGYGGDLCDPGSREYVRFYLDYGEGDGWQDVGYTAVNVHDIPNGEDCKGDLDKPLNYVVRHNISPKLTFCSRPKLPKVKAVLVWNHIPPANDPNLNAGGYVWGDVKEERIQIKPIKIFKPDFQLDDAKFLLEKAIKYPEISLKKLASIESDGDEQLNALQNSLKIKTPTFDELADYYAKVDKSVKPERFAAGILQKSIDSDSLITLDKAKSILATKAIDFSKLILEYHKLKCNTNYEELYCVGLDYHREALVGTLKIKRPYGYMTGSCGKGSKEYVTFFIQDQRTCKWIEVGVASVDVYDFEGVDEGIAYSAVLPFNFEKYKKYCSDPQILKIRGVLSWNTPVHQPACSVWGNVVDSYIQIRHKIQWDTNKPGLLIVGGVAVDNINNFTGLTNPGAKLEFTQQDVKDDSPFGGKIVVQGISAPFGDINEKYRIRITNLSTMASYYYEEDLPLIGYDLNGDVVHHTISADPVTKFYPYQKYHNNVESILARFTPGTNDRLLITIENQGGGTDAQIIQMDNTLPDLSISINDGGDCAHYSKNDTIQGNYTVVEEYMELWKLYTTVCNCGPGDSLLIASGDTNVNNGAFSISANVNKNCGHIHLQVFQKTILNSTVPGKWYHRSHIVCIDQ